ncbi:hypothetical protein M2138_000621 [Dysgonomonadaceae bacterium PH5-43]|nr:hypothetical protein [Dysgonomonadaceae bacterium PH5-43]
MKKITKIFGSLFLACGLLFSACGDMLDVDTDRVVLTKDHDLDSANDTFNTVVGILAKLRNLGDRYVVLGELRAELMDVTENSSQFLKDIAALDYKTEDNPYLSSREYYEIINNCNYYIQNVDTGLPLVDGLNVMKIECAAVKSIRAWTYLQLVLNYGTVPYIETPILTVGDTKKEYDLVDIYGLADRLIPELLPLVDLPMPNYALKSPAVGQYLACYYMFQPAYLLGDLYLWTQQYDEAAKQYYKIISKEVDVKPGGATVYRSLDRNRWGTNPVLTSILNPDCGYNGFTTYSSATTHNYTIIADYTGSSAKVMNIHNMTRSVSAYNEYYTYELKPSDAAINMYNSETYCYWDEDAKMSYYLPGDMRGCLVPMYGRGCDGTYAYSFTSSNDTIPYIRKYSSLNAAFIHTYPGLLLRYAEAINRSTNPEGAGFPSMAMAMLKYGLTENNIAAYVDSTEAANRPDFMKFDFLAPGSQNEAGLNRGLHSAGCGDSKEDTTYVIPADLDLASIEAVEYVEDLILKEFALETAFEGNRFHDLMRYSMRRNDNSIIAKTVAKKNPALESKLMDSKNWYLPSKYTQIEIEEEVETPPVVE